MTFKNLPNKEEELSGFLPAFLGLLMMAAGVTYWINSFRLFLALPIPYLPWVTLVAESSLAVWLVLGGFNEEEWRAQAGTIAPLELDQGVLN